MSKISKLLEKCNNDSKNKQTINEASSATFDELEPQAQDFIKRFGLDKIDTPIFSFKNCEFFDGIHGFILSVADSDNLRYDKKQLQKLIADKDFRFLDVKSIGF